MTPVTATCGKGFRGTKFPRSAAVMVAAANMGLWAAAPRAGLIPTHGSTGSLKLVGVSLAMPPRHDCSKLTVHSLYGMCVCPLLRSHEPLILKGMSMILGSHASLLVIQVGTLQPGYLDRLQSCCSLTRKLHFRKNIELHCAKAIDVQRKGAWDRSTELPIGCCRELLCPPLFQISAFTMYPGT